MNIQDIEAAVSELEHLSVDTQNEARALLEVDFIDRIHDMLQRVEEQIEEFVK